MEEQQDMTIIIDDLMRGKLKLQFEYEMELRVKSEEQWEKQFCYTLINLF
jgi:hypothetical protein